MTDQEIEPQTATLAVSRQSFVQRLFQFTQTSSLQCCKLAIKAKQ